MIRNRILLKAIAIFLIVETLANTVAPTISWALTAGPTAPEATSFEPVDTTDMVNLASGDLAYNIPLLEVPGPSGGYPLSLSYHAGIQPNEDASWTGLGWVLNPGAIVRNVNGFADDHSNVPNTNRFYWEGGGTSTYSVGVTLGIAGTPASVSAGLSFSQDTYMGSGVGAHIGVGSSFSEKSPFGANVSIGVSPFGDPYASTGVSVSIGKSEKQAMSLSTGIGLSTNFKSVGGYGHAGLSVNYSGRSIGALDASIATGSKGMNSNVGIAGASFTSNSKSGQVSTNSSGFEVPIPIFPGGWLSLGYSYQRYWIDEIESTEVNGALYYPVPEDPNVAYTTHYFDDRAFDTYSLMDPNDGDTFASLRDSDPNKSLGGSFPNYDNYQVHAQGLFGSMRPYSFQKHLYKRNDFTKDDDGDKHYQNIQYDLVRNQTKENKRSEFRFVNDFANRFEYTPAAIEAEENVTMQYNFATGTALKVGENAVNEYTSNLVQGARNIIWFTNGEIATGDDRVSDAGFIDTKATGFVRETDANSPKGKQIGGYTIVNESGVKYHFALPAYSYDDYMYSEKKGAVQTFNEFFKGEPYAYTWYLTAITGPDFVDRGPGGPSDGILNEYDWGYWVEFEYGKWTDMYAWRNPSEGMTSDIDDHFQNFSEGRKELYYLDAVRTKTHTALFFKDIRKDAKSSLLFFRDYYAKLTGNSPFIPEIKRESIVEAAKAGGFFPTDGTCHCEIIDISTPSLKDEGYLNYNTKPTSTLKLEKVILIDNESLKDIPYNKQGGQQYHLTTEASWTIQQNLLGSGAEQQCDFSPIEKSHHLYYNVLDIYDLQASPALLDKAHRVLQFDTEYLLTPETTNSYDLSSEPYVNEGKLTLTALHFLGKHGTPLLPPMRFSYDLDKPVKGSAKLLVNGSDYTFTAVNSGLEEGDIITFKSSSNDCYALVKDIDQGVHSLKILGKNLPSGGFITFRTTKNPPYNKDADDNWGMYKPDYINTSHEYQDRLVSTLSSKNNDAWSLRTVSMVTGAKMHITYQPDDYRKAVVNTNYDFRIVQIYELEEANRFKIQLHYQEENYFNELKAGDEIYLSFIYGKGVYAPCDLPEVTENLVFKGSATIVERTNEYLTIDSPLLDSKFRGYDYTTYPGGSGYPCLHEVAFGFDYGYLVPLNKIGGGIRVSEIQLSDGFNTRSTLYDYTNNGVSSGMTTFEPNLWGRDADGWYNIAQEFILNEGHDLLALSREIPAPGVLYEHVTVREKVSIEGVESELPTYSTYNFTVFDKGMVGIKYEPADIATFSQQTAEGYIHFSKKETRNISLKDYTSRVGSLKSIKLYDADNSLLSETTNLFLHDGINASLITSGINDLKLTDDFEANIKFYEPKLETQFNNQGVIEESFTEGRFISREDTDFSQQGIISKREQFPAIQIGQVVKNYKTGITVSTSTLAFDYYSGQTTATLSSDGYGNTYLSEVTPAYRKYSAMGPSSGGGKNMLTQQAGTVAYKVDAANNNQKLGVLSASVQTWSDQVPVLEQDQYFSGEAEPQTGIWRKHAAYTYIGSGDVQLRSDGLYPVANFSPFEGWATGDSNPDWKKTEEVKLYDIHSHALEAVDVNGNYAATKMTSNKERVLATITNARYNEFAYSGAEEISLADYSGGGIFMGESESDPLHAHTGTLGFKLGPNKTGINASVSTLKKNYDRKMHVSFWIHESAVNDITLGYRFVSNLSPVTEYTPMDVSITESKKAGEWYLCDVYISIPQNSTETPVNFQTTLMNTGSQTVYIDDIRVHPVHAAMSSFVYNSWGELTHIFDNNNLYTEYRYDDAGRLTSTHRESFQSNYGITGIVKTSETVYNYALNNPFMTNITTSVSGTTGSLYPSGEVEVLRGGTMTFELRDACATSRFTSVSIDGVPLNLNQASVNLLDGTTVLINGKILEFVNVQLPHTLSAVFNVASWSGDPVVECIATDNGNGNICYEGRYRYGYYNDCGVIDDWTEAGFKWLLPEALQDMAEDDCCDLSEGNSNCDCEHGW